MRFWGREDEADVAEQRILDAAGKAFVELGVPATGMPICGLAFSGG